MLKIMGKMLLLISLFVSFTVATFFPQSVYAACTNVGVGAVCDAGYQSCESWGYPGKCCQNPTAECYTAPTPTPRASQNYKCDPLGGCVADPNGPYADRPSCVAGCSGLGPSTSRFRCDPQGCVYDPQGSLTAAQCEQSCRASPTQTGPCPGLTGDDKNNCEGCVTGGGAWTALGCISTSPSGFIAWFLEKVVGITGGIAFLLILYGGFQVLTSGGDPEKLNNGKDIIISAIAGVLMIVFSVILLKIIGVDILQIPGFSGTSGQSGFGGP